MGNYKHFIYNHCFENIFSDELNDLLEKFRQPEGGMTEEQAVTARDIRRRGKNKVFFLENTIQKI